MNTKLTLTLEKEVVELANQYAKSFRNGGKLFQVCYHQTNENQGKATFPEGSKIKSNH